MNKKKELAKTIQLAVFAGIAIASLIVIFTDEALYQAIGHDASVRTLCVLLWLALLAAFVSVYLDFRAISRSNRNYRELDYTVRNDHVAGIANRYSCDTMIEKYADRPLPDTVGCVMLELANLQEINRQHGHAAGNAAIQDFSDTLSGASMGLCFVGRNGGNKFMALFEDCSETRLNTFMSRVAQRIEEHNRQADATKLEYRSGRAFHEGSEITSITQLISLADRRISGNSDSITGIPNRNSCDDIISQYLDKPLPADVGCVMVDLANLREINDQYGRLEGNRSLRRFSDALREAARDLCFVGRNSGTGFLALFAQCDEEKLALFIKRLQAEVGRQNDDPNRVELRFTWGTAFHEDGVDSINRLIALAAARVRDNESD